MFFHSLLLLLLVFSSCHRSVQPNQTDGASASAPSGSGSGKPSILGKWVGEMESFEFKENGEGVYFDQTFRYHADSVHLYIETIFDTTEVAYILYGDSLKLIKDGQFSVFRREIEKPKGQ
ncbi:MAG TPA: hypothetical protein VJ508_06770 [Saprospiraceae bacterium]|nr:hypothetical protein [Saprospiraceae bacterium]